MMIIIIIIIGNYPGVTSLRCVPVKSGAMYPWYRVRVKVYCAGKVYTVPCSRECSRYRVIGVVSLIPRAWIIGSPTAVLVSFLWISGLCSEVQSVVRCSRL